MDWCLIADISGTLSMLWMIAAVAAGLGLVIFVHELGHFLAAKACGVKVEKFYIGFDIPMGPLPSALLKFRWGETEYGVGILPLGGYVKMLGQDDNPRNQAKENERIKVRKDASAGVEGADALGRGGGSRTRPRRLRRDDKASGESGEFECGSAQLSGQAGLAADDHHLGRRDHEPDFRRDLRGHRLRPGRQLHAVPRGRHRARRSGLGRRTERRRQDSADRPSRPPRRATAFRQGSDDRRDAQRRRASAGPARPPGGPRGDRNGSP